MTTSKIIKGVVGGGRYTVTTPIVKEDYGLYLQIEGIELPATYEVDFSNDEHSGTSVTMIGNSDGVLIPNQFISSGKDIFAFLYHVGEDFGRTVYKFRIPNKLRPDRTDEEPTPEEQSVIDQTIAALNTAVESAQEAQEAIENMSVSAITLAEGASATVTKTEQDGVVHLDFGIPVGATGAQGERGEKGEKGDRGEQGIQGIQGERGLTGAKGDRGDKGDKGEQGDDYVLTEQDKQDIAELVDVPVDDVQINGTSIVENGVANVPKASASNLGAVKTSSTYGTQMYGSNSDILGITLANDNDTKAGNSGYRALTAQQQHRSVFYGLAKAAGDTTQSASSNAVGAYTEDAKIAIQKMLGVYREWELIADVTVEEDSVQVDIVTDGNGQPFELTKMFVRVWLQPSTTGANDYVAAQNLLIFDNGVEGSSAAPTRRYMANGASTFMEYVSKLMCGINYSLGSSGSGVTTTASVDKASGAYDNIKSYRGFRLKQYSSSMTLIPAGTNIKLYGIRA